MGELGRPGGLWTRVILCVRFAPLQHMFKKCFHQWEVTRRKFNPPKPGLKASNLYDEDYMMELIYGRTNIELTCTKCGDIEHRSTIGDV